MGTGGVFFVFCLVIVFTITPPSWCFSKDRIARRISSAEAFTNDEPTIGSADVLYDSEPIPEYYAAIDTNATNSTDKNLYVIKAVVYEIGILTEVPDNDTDVDVENERVDISLFSSGANGSVIDLEHIPFPVQTNISGEVVSLIAPVPLSDILTLNRTSSLEDSHDAVENGNLETNDPILSPYDVLPTLEEATTEQQQSDNYNRNRNED